MTIRGQILGVGPALRGFLRGYEMSDDFTGVSGCVLTLPVGNWLDYAWLEQGITPNIAAGSGVAQTIFTVPDDERAVLEGVQGYLNSGDNTILDIRVTFPVGYGNGSRVGLLSRLVTPAVNIYWPHVGQTIERGLGPGPILLEPGSIVEFLPGSAGVVVSTFGFSLMLRRTMVIRAMVP